MQREKPVGFSLCCFLLFLTLFITSLHSNGQKQANTLVLDALHGNFTSQPNAKNLEVIVENDHQYGAAAVLTSTFNAVLRGTPENITSASEIAETVLNIEHIPSYNKIYAHTAQSLLKALNEEYIAALLASLKAHKSLQKHVSHSACLEPEILAMAKVYNDLYKKIPRSYTLFLDIAGIDSMPLKTVKTCKESRWPELTTTIDVVHQILKGKDTIATEKPAPPVGQMMIASHYLKHRKPMLALEHLKKIDSTHNQPTAQYYYLGMAHLRLGHYARAEWYLNKYLFVQQTGRYIKSALLRKKWIAIIQNKPYKHLDDAIAHRGSTYTFSDRQALKEYRDQYHRGLLEARICYDGGRFRDAISLLNSINTKKLTNHRLNEYHYRKGRSFQQMKQYNKAINEIEKLMMDTIIIKKPCWNAVKYCLS